jgi:hypothetical protein
MYFQFVFLLSKRRANGEPYVTLYIDRNKREKHIDKEKRDITKTFSSSKVRK